MAVRVPQANCGVPDRSNRNIVSVIA